MAYLALALLGPFQATLDGLPVEGLNSERLRALLAYLAVGSGREYPREQVASLLWPERPDREALSALRYALSNLRSALGDRRSPGNRQALSPFLLVTRSSVQFNPDSDHWLDVAEFQELSSRSDVASLERAVSLYRGPFLHGLSVRDSPAFDEWMLLKGEETRRSTLSMLGRLTSLQMARGEHEEAARLARRQLELEPYREQAHRQLMVALALGGERPAALAHYEACRDLLARELGCEPEDETKAVHAQIRDSRPSQLWSQPPPTPATLVTVSATWPSSRFVAREQELARLTALLSRALAGHGGVALIAGEAGSGKTALLEEFARQAGQTHGRLIALRGRCNAHAGAGDPYLPFREMLQVLAGDVEGRRAGGTLLPEQAQQVWQALPAVGAALVEHGPDLIDTFVPGEALLRRTEGFPILPSAGRWRARLRAILHRAVEDTVPAPVTGHGASASQPDLFAQMTQVLAAVSTSWPLLLAVDDLQWADGATAALLFHLGRRLAGSRILLVCACRPEVLAAGEEGQAIASGVGAVLRELCREWGDILVDLDQTDGRAFVEAYVDSEPNRLRAAFRQALYDHTGGNPLFTAELLRSFERENALVKDEAGRWVEGTAPDWEHWPPQVEAVIAGHLAGLPEDDRVLLRAASVQGEQFAAEVAARVLGLGEEAVVRRLSGPLRTRHRLVQAVSMDRLPCSGQRLSRYRFRHSLVHANVYRSLDAVERARLHEATGRALDAIYGLEGEQPSGQVLALAPELARHFEAAGLALEAARYRLEAGRWAARLVAYGEAIAHLERGLALLEGAAPSGERLRLELVLCLALVVPASLRRGWQAPILTQALERLADLTQNPELRDDPLRLSALTVLAQTTNWAANPDRASRVGEHLLGLTEDGDLQSLMLVHWTLGQSHFLQGGLVAAREHLDQGLGLYNWEIGRSLGLLFGAEPEVTLHAMLGFTLWLLGYPDQGRAALQQALARALEIDQPPSVAFAHLVAGIVYSVLGRDVAAAQIHGAALRPLDKAGLVYGAWADLLAALSRADAFKQAQGSLAPDQRADSAGRKPGLEQTLAQAAEAGAALQAAGSGVGQVAQLLVQAQMLVRSGQARMALGVMDQALTWIGHTGVRVLGAEVWRMRGELLLEDGPDSPKVGEPEDCFRRALDIAREQQARWLELRAAVSLARLWGARGRRSEACELLAGIYSWFTEGFDTPDLVEAKALLEQLT